MFEAYSFDCLISSSSVSGCPASFFFSTTAREYSVPSERRHFVTADAVLGLHGNTTVSGPLLCSVQTGLLLQASRNATRAAGMSLSISMASPGLVEEPR